MGITHRYTLLMFLLITVTVLILTYFANHQMDTHFRDYLVERQVYISQNPEGITTIDMVMGPVEQTMMSSVHQSLYWIGIGMILIGLVASYTLAACVDIHHQRSKTAIKLNKFHEI